MNIDTILRSVVTVRSSIPEDAFTAATLGTRREGSGVVIREDGLVLTIGYLITEAEEVWLTSNDGQLVAAHALAYDQETGFGLVQALGQLGLPALDFGDAAKAKIGDPVVLADGIGQCRRGKHRGQAGIRRILGVPAGRGDLHRARPSIMGRRRARRRGRQAVGHRLAAPANEPKRRDRRHQYGRADRPVATNSRRPAHARPGQQAAAALARARLPPRATAKSWS